MLKCRFPNGRLNFLMLELDKESSSVDDQMGTISVGADRMIKFKPKFGVPNGKLYVVNACNGLVCLKSDKRWDSYYICNFLTSQFLTVKQVRPRFHFLYKYVLGSCPMDTTTTQGHLCGGSENPYVCGLTPARGEVCPETHPKGPNLMTHQYKLLRILKTSIQYVAEVLTLGSDEWRRIDNAPKSCYNFEAFLNGSYHWYDNKGGECSIWAFHFGIEKFSRIPTPGEFNAKHHAALTVFDSCLCFCCGNGNGFAYAESEVWLMKEYGVGHSWVKQFVIDAPKPVWYYPYKPLMRVANGQVLINCCDSRLALHDPETGSYKEVKFDGDFVIRRLQAYDADFSRLLDGVQRD